MSNENQNPCQPMNPQCAREFGKISAQIAGQTNDIAEIKAHVKAIVASLKGNGRPGLETRVDHLETKIDNKIKKDFEEKERTDKKRYQQHIPLALAVISALSALACAYISTFGG